MLSSGSFNFFLDNDSFSTILWNCSKCYDINGKTVTIISQIISFLWQQSRYLFYFFSHFVIFHFWRLMELLHIRANIFFRLCIFLYSLVNLSGFTHAINLHCQMIFVCNITIGSTFLPIYIYYQFARKVIRWIQLYDYYFGVFLSTEGIWHSSLSCLF